MQFFVFSVSLPHLSLILDRSYKGSPQLFVYLHTHSSKVSRGHLLLVFSQRGLLHKNVGILAPSERSPVARDRRSDNRWRTFGNVVLEGDCQLTLLKVHMPNPKELNPYFRDDGSGYPEDVSQTGASAVQLPHTSVVGDGGASWRLKALKRAREQAAREGRKFDQVILSSTYILGKKTPYFFGASLCDQKEAQTQAVDRDHGAKTDVPVTEKSVSRHVKRDIPRAQKELEVDPDMHLAQKIMQNKRYHMSRQADEEYDYANSPSRKHKRKTGGITDQKLTGKNYISNRLMTQQERCTFCFENPTRPKHLIVSIAYFTYLMVPQWEPIVEGHCCILPKEHESATRSIGNDVWDEIRNFKKCLIMMFAEQDKDVVFLETVMGLAKQRRHCLVECIPVSRDIAKEAPLYFKKAIDEAEEEWSQHNAKKLIETSVKGLRASIPKDFPYFHVEFGLDRGFVHVIDDERNFESNFGLNVIRGMLRLPEEDMYRWRKQDSVETQRRAVANFAKEWDLFDWTKQL